MSKEILKGIAGLFIGVLAVLLSPVWLAWLLGRLVWSMVADDDFMDLGDLL